MPSNSPRTAGLYFLRGKVGAFLATPAGSAIARKPATLAYGLEEQPPAAVTWVSAVQHVRVCAIFMIYPLIIAHQPGLSTDRITNILQLGFLVLAVASLLQTLPRGPVGSRLLAPAIFTGVYLAPSLLAVKAGGLPLVWGMTVFAGLVEMTLSRAWSHLRPFVPPESAGLSLNLLFRVGIRRTVTMAIDPAAPNANAVSDFIERSAGVWGARRDVTDRVEFAVQQTIDAILGSDEARGRIDLGSSYDEFVIDVLVAYDGAPLEFPPLPPSREEILETEYGHRRLAGFLVRRHADRLTTTRWGGRPCTAFTSIIDRAFARGAGRAGRTLSLRSGRRVGTIAVDNLSV